MGHRKKSAPRRGSLGVRPRKRAESIVPKVRSWPNIITEEPRILGFMGYKVGMTHLLVIDDRPGSPTYNKEIFMPVTLVETPPLIGLAIRFYNYDPNSGLRSVGEMWAPKEALDDVEHLFLERAVKKINLDGKEVEKRLDELSRKASEARLIVASRPYLTGGLSQKKPFIFEVPIAASTYDEKIQFAKNILGKEIRVSQVFRPGMFIDVIGVTKGKGFQGVIKRFGVKELPRWHKHRKASRTVGSRGSRVGALSSTPQAGQMGFHQRTEYNKRIIYMGSLDSMEKGSKDELIKAINPAGGWHRYGLIKTDFLVVAGTLQGPVKRPLILRYPVRKTPWEPEGSPKIIFAHKITIPQKT